MHDMQICRPSNAVNKRHAWPTYVNHECKEGGLPAIERPSLGDSFSRCKISYSDK
jgi:hypothetical protein